MALGEVVLTVLAHRPMTGYEIVKTFDRVYVYLWRSSHQQVYRELARLHEDGLVSFQAVRQTSKPDKKVYRITKAGRERLKSWVAEPAGELRPKLDHLVKMVAAAMVDKRALKDGAARLRQATTEVLKTARGMERECMAQPFEAYSEYERMLYMTLRRGVLMLEAQMVWLDEVDDYLRTGKLKRR